MPPRKPAPPADEATPILTVMRKPRAATPAKAAAPMKTSAAKAPAAKPAAKAPAAKAPARRPPAKAAAPAAKPARPERTLKLRDLLEIVAKTSGTKKKAARAVVEATLAALGDALAEGAELNLPPLGKARVNRQRDTAGGEILVIRLRRPTPGDKPGKAAKEALAPSGD